MLLFVCVQINGLSTAFNLQDSAEPLLTFRAADS